MKYSINPGSTNVTVYFSLKDINTGDAITGLVYNSAGATAYYVRALGTATAITLATQTVDGAHTDGGFVEVNATYNKGLYRLDLPDAVCASGVDFAMVTIEFDAAFVKTAHIDLNNADNVLTLQLTESYAADGVAPTLTQAIMLIQQQLTEFSRPIGSTTWTTKKLDGSNTAATFTLDDGDNPGSMTRTT